MFKIHTDIAHDSQIGVDTKNIKDNLRKQGQMLKPFHKLFQKSDLFSDTDILIINTS
jgi:hypothetical protein